MNSLVFDLDGTAVPDGAPTVESERLIQAFQSLPEDVPAIAATGRIKEFALPIISQLKLKHDSIVANGAHVVRPQTGEITWQRMLSKRQVAAIIAICCELDYQFCVEGDEIGPRLTASEQAARKSAGVFLLDVPYEVAANVHEEVSKIADVNAYISSGWLQGQETFDVNVSHRDATKATALRHLIGKYGLDVSSMACVVDGINDIPLCETVGYRIAVANAHPAVLAMADEVVPAQSDDGLASVVERFTTSKLLVT